MRQAREQQMEEERQAALLEPDSPGVSVEIKRLHPCNIAAVEAKAIAEAARSYVCCTPERFGIECETVRMENKSRAQCDQQAQEANAHIDEVDQVTLWTDTDRGDRCQDRLSIADRGGPAEDCSWAGCAGLCETPEATVCCTPDDFGIDCQVIGGPTDWSAY